MTQRFGLFAPRGTALAAVVTGAALSVVFSTRSAHAQTADAGSPDATAADAGGLRATPDPYADPPASDAGAADASATDAAATPAAAPAAAPDAGAARGDAGTGDDDEQPEASGTSQGNAEEDARARQLTPEQRELLRADQGELSSPDDRGPQRTLVPPIYLHEWGNGHDTRVVFPFYFNSQVGAASRLFVLPYFRGRSPTSSADGLFPFVFHFHGRSDDGSSSYATNIVPPFWLATTQGPGRAHSLYTGFAPLFSYGERFNERGWLQSEHLVILPALTFHRWWPTGQSTVVGGLVWYLREGASATTVAFPFFFRRSTPAVTWNFALPGIYHQNNHENGRSLTVVLNTWVETGPNLFSFNFAPLFFHRRDGNYSRTTFAPLFHTEWGPNHFTFATPLAGYTRVGNEHTLITPLYQQHRGLTNWDAAAPFFFYSRTPSLGRTTLQVLNVVYDRSPTGYAWGVFPLIGRFHEDGRYDTTATPLFVHSTVEATRSSLTWIFPSFHIERTPEVRIFNIYPLWYSASGRGWHHNVFFPLVWDVGDENTGRQTTVVAPFFARVQERNSYTQWVFPNIVNWVTNRGGETSYGVDIFPFVQWGSPRRGDSYWSIFEGLVGYRRQGGFEQLRLFWAPITLAGTPPASNATSAPAGSGSSAPAGSGSGGGATSAPQARIPRADVLLDL